MLLRATIAGVRGVVATTSYNAGDVVLRLSGRVTSFPTENAIAINQHLHITDPRISGVREDSVPNVAARDGILLASQHIFPGDEIKVPLSKSSNDP